MSNELGWGHTHLAREASHEMSLTHGDVAGQGRHPMIGIGTLDDLLLGLAIRRFSVVEQERASTMLVA